MIKYKYRIKTEKEFLNEFGTNWRNTILCEWNDRMDHLYGKEIESNLISLFLQNGRLDFSVFRYMSLFGWNISHHMVKEIRITPNYNEKRILVYD